MLAVVTYRNYWIACDYRYQHLPHIIGGRDPLTALFSEVSVALFMALAPIVLLIASVANSLRELLRQRWHRQYPVGLPACRPVLSCWAKAGRGRTGPCFGQELVKATMRTPSSLPLMSTISPWAMCLPSSTRSTGSPTARLMGTTLP